MIEIQVYLHTTLVMFSPDGETRKFNFQLPAGSSIKDLVESLKITRPADSLLFARNGKVADDTDILVDGDKVHIMMPISGG